MSESLSHDQHTGSEYSSDSDSDMSDDRDTPRSEASTAFYDCREFSDEEGFKGEEQTTPRASESHGALSPLSMIPVNFGFKNTISPQHLEYDEHTNMTPRRSASQAIAVSNPPSLHHSQPVSNLVPEFGCSSFGLGTQSPTSFSSGCTPNFGVSSFSTSMPYERPNNTMDIDSSRPAEFSRDFSNTLPAKPKRTKLYREVPLESNPSDEPTKLGKRDTKKTPLFLPDEDSILHKTYKRSRPDTYQSKKGPIAPTVKLRRANATLVETAYAYEGTIRDQIKAMATTKQQMLEIIRNENATTLKKAEEEHAQRIAEMHENQAVRERTLHAEYAKMEVCGDIFPMNRTEEKIRTKRRESKRGNLPICRRQNKRPKNWRCRIRLRRRGSRKRWHFAKRVKQRSKNRRFGSQK
jgi:hypothetical protein